MASGPVDSLERMTPTELIGLVRNLIAEVGRLRGENEKLSEALAMQRVENQALKDEIARVKHLPPRPPLKPSGMEKATDRPDGRAEKGDAPKRRRGPGVSKLSIDRTVSPHFSNKVAHRAAESGKSCFARTTCADSEGWPDADGV